MTLDEKFIDKDKEAFEKFKFVTMNYFKLHKNESGNYSDSETYRLFIGFELGLEHARQESQKELETLKASLNEAVEVITIYANNNSDNYDYGYKAREFLEKINNQLKGTE